MPRIRTIKPEFWTSEDIANISRDARLLFIGMWNFADDDGNGVAGTKSLKMKILPGDQDATNGKITSWLGELVAQNLIAIYEAEDKQYYHVANWHHQRIDKPQRAKYPSFQEHSKNIPRVFLPDRIGKDAIGKDRIGKRKYTPVSYSPEFNSLWCIHRKGGKIDAFRAFNKFNPDTDTLVAWIEKLKAYKLSQQWKKGYAPNLSTWLNQGYFDGEIPAEQLLTHDEMKAEVDRSGGTSEDFEAIPIEGEELPGWRRK